MIAEALRKKGIYMSSALWGGAFAMAKHLLNQPAYPAHIVAFGDRHPRHLAEIFLTPIDGPGIARQWDFASHTMESTLTAPGFLDFAVSFEAHAREYFDGEQPYIYSVNSFWKKPLGQAGWHYDTDDRKIFCVFVYGSDMIIPDDGPHVYAEETHLWTEEEKAPYHNTDKEPPGQKIAIFGPAGGWFVTDTRGLHNGIAPRSWRSPRLLTWVRYGVSCPPKSYHTDELSPVPASRLNLPAPRDNVAELTKLIVDWSR